MYRTRFTRRNRLLILPLVVAAGVLTACPPPATVPDGVPAPPGVAFTEANAAALLMAYGEGAIQRAQLAQQRATDPRVRQYAATMAAAYQTGAQQAATVFQTRGITPTPETTAQRVREVQRQSVQALQAWEGAEFDRRYIANEIAMQRWLLETGERTLLPAARDRQMRTLLMELREPLMESIREAERIQQAIGRPS